MDAILRVDLEAGIALFLAHHFIDARRTITLRRLVIKGQIIADRDRRILELQMDRLEYAGLKEACVMATNRVYREAEIVRARATPRRSA